MQWPWCLFTEHWLKYLDTDQYNALYLCGFVNPLAEEIHGACGMSQWLKCYPQKPDKQCLISLTHTKESTNSKNLGSDCHMHFMECEHIHTHSHTCHIIYTIISRTNQKFSSEKAYCLRLSLFGSVKYESESHKWKAIPLLGDGGILKV